jgi:hypothetical protein
MYVDAKGNSATFGKKEMEAQGGAPVVRATTDIGEYAVKMPYSSYGKKKKKKRDNRHASLRVES